VRIHEVPVDWVDDPDSRVDLMRTALQDLRGVARLLAAGAIARFLAVGVASTIAFALLFLLLRGPVGSTTANALALAVTAVANTAANRRLTFGVRGRIGLARDHVLGALVFLITLGLTSGALGVLHALDPHPAPALEIAVLVAAGAAATTSRFVGLRAVVGRPRSQPAHTPLSECSQDPHPSSPS
jgi:putative flippase GtrA